MNNPEQTAGPLSQDADINKAVGEIHERYDELRRQLSQVIVGMEDVTEQLMIAVLCRGHCILQGMPGLAKTLLISQMASLMDLTFHRIQFTPDLMPADITGGEVLEEDRATGRREFRFVKGPVFANLVLADEINRTPPKTQSALLEAMEERQLSVSGQTFKLPDPFFVLATQNPVEVEGTYPLPEAQPRGDRLGPCVRRGGRPRPQHAAGGRTPADRTQEHGAVGRRTSGQYRHADGRESPSPLEQAGACDDGRRAAGRLADHAAPHHPHVQRRSSRRRYRQHYHASRQGTAGVGRVRLTSGSGCKTSTQTAGPAPRLLRSSRGAD